MIAWEVVRRQVAIGGIVSDETGVPVNRARLTVQRKRDGVPQDKCESRADGSYYFTDLGDGEYIVTARSGVKRIQREATVKHDDQGTLAMVWLDLKLST
jgi:hypothetical protein